jgi:hypothetical protein
MFVPTTASGKLIYNTVMLETTGPPGPGLATGFLLAFNFEGGISVPCLVTNKHALNDVARVRWHFHIANPEGTAPVRIQEVGLDDVGHWRIDHPDEDVDLCVINLSELYTEIKSHGWIVFNKFINETNIPSDEVLQNLSAMEDATMIGYPDGLIDSVNYLPILRRGTTASHPSLDFQGRPEGVLDIACFPGSSGSPVFVLNEGAFRDSRGNMLSGERMVFLGINYATWQYRAGGEMAKIKTPTKRVPMTNIPMHVSFYVKAKALLAIRALLVTALGTVARTPLRNDAGGNGL